MDFRESQMINSTQLIRDRLVPSDLISGVIYQIKKSEDIEEVVASISPKFKGFWFALKHEIDLQYGKQDRYPNAYIFDRNERCVWGFDGCFEARGISSVWTIDKQLEGKQLLAAKLGIY